MGRIALKCTVVAVAKFSDSVVNRINANLIGERGAILSPRDVILCTDHFHCVPNV